jgi:ABC-type transport system involved in multi-copper enzyme maturation permease subunit
VSEPGVTGRRHARVGAYALWQLRDYLKDRGVPTLIVALLSGYLGLSPIIERMPTRTDVAPAVLLTRFGSAEAVYAARMMEFNHEFLRGILGTIVFVGALFAMNGIVANDRKQGFYRFLFAKPMTPARYYGQAFLVHWAGFVAVMVVLGLVYGALIWPVLSRPLLLVIALMFVAYAGIAFLLSAAARWDWMSLVAVTVAATFLWARYGESTHPLARLLFLLPPLHRADEVYASVSGAPMYASGAPTVIPWSILAWLAGYGAACFAAGLVVLRHRRLAIV